MADVSASSRWYQHLLGARSGHGGGEYDRLLVDDTLVLQLHSRQIDHHHGALANPSEPVGDGVAMWFAVEEFDAVVRRSRELRARVDFDVHVNPNAAQREIWLRDPDGYRVVLAEM